MARKALLVVLVALCFIASVSCVDAKPVKHPRVHGKGGYIKHIVPKAAKKLPGKAGTLAVSEPPTNPAAPNVGWFLQDGPGTILSTPDASQTHWGRNLVVATTGAGIHGNLGQAAHKYDEALVQWTALFVPEVQILGGADFIAFCGSTSTINVQVYDFTLDLFLYDGAVTDVPLCN